MFFCGGGVGGQRAGWRMYFCDSDQGRDEGRGRGAGQKETSGFGTHCVVITGQGLELGVEVRGQESGQSRSSQKRH